MALIYVPERKIQANFSPDFPVEVNWSNPITNAIAFCYLPGYPYDQSGILNTIGVFQGAGTAKVGASMYSTGTVAPSGLQIATSAPLLGGLSNSTVIAIARTSAGITTSIGATSDGLIGSGGNAIYCERAATGNDIYKLIVSAPPSLSAEFTYRNDAGTLLQQRVVDATINDGNPHFYALTKNGTTHTVISNALSSSAAFGSSSTAFTDASMNRNIGYDVADNTAAWNGYIDLVIGWSRTLSGAEIASIRNNPFQLLRQKSKSIWVAVSSGATGAISTNSGNSAGSSAAITVPVAPAINSANTAQSNAALTIATVLATNAADQASSSPALSVATPLTTNASNAATSTPALAIPVALSTNSGNTATSAANLTGLASGAIATNSGNTAASAANLAIATPLATNSGNTASSSANLTGLVGGAITTNAGNQAGSSASLTIATQLQASATNQATSSALLIVPVSLGTNSGNQAASNSPLYIATRLQTASSNSATSSANLAVAGGNLLPNMRYFSSGIVRRNRLSAEPRRNRISAGL